MYRLLRCRPLRVALLCFCTSLSAAALYSQAQSPDKEPQVKTLDARLSNYPYPFSVNYFEVENQKQSLQMAYMDVKPIEKKDAPAVVLLHGKNFNGAYWEETARALHDAGYRVVIPDQIGFGKSSKPEHFQYSFSQLAHNTRELLASLDIEQAVIVGHSMGGMLASRFALNYPQMTRKLILVNPIGLEDYQKFFPWQPLSYWYKGELEKTAQDIKQYQLNSYYDGDWKPEYQPWVDVLTGWTQSEQYPLIAWNAALTYDMIYTQPVVHDFPRIKAPTLLLIGTRDRTALGKSLVDGKTRETMGQYQHLGKATKRAIPEATLVEFKDIGHLPHIEAFDQFIEPFMDFIKK